MIVSLPLLLLLLLYLYSHIVIQLCSIKMVHVLVTMLQDTRYFISGTKPIVKTY